MEFVETAAYWLGVVMGSFLNDLPLLIVVIWFEIRPVYKTMRGDYMRTEDHLPRIEKLEERLDLMLIRRGPDDR